MQVKICCLSKQWRNSGSGSRSGCPGQKWIRSTSVSRYFLEGLRKGREDCVTPVLSIIAVIWDYLSHIIVPPSRTGIAKVAQFGFACFLTFCNGNYHSRRSNRKSVDRLACTIQSVLYCLCTIFDKALNPFYFITKRSKELTIGW